MIRKKEQPKTAEERLAVLEESVSQVEKVMSKLVVLVERIINSDDALEEDEVCGRCPNSFIAYAPKESECDVLQRLVDPIQAFIKKYHNPRTVIVIKGNSVQILGEEVGVYESEL